MKKFPPQSVDKVYTLSQTERNVGRFGDFFLVGIVAYGRGKNSPKENPKSAKLT